MTVLEKIIRADDFRKTRFHDEKGNLVPLRRTLLNGTRAYLTGVARLAFGIRPEVPWISYDARRRIASRLNSESRVLEFGSGMSTLWLARHAGLVCSVESHQPWHEKVTALLAEHSIDNVRYHFAATRTDYIAPAGVAGFDYDLILVDGDYRSDCIRANAGLLREGGILYLDNSDKDSGEGGGDVRLAERLALEFAGRTGSTVTYFTDFAPTQLTPNQGMMVEVGRKKGMTG